MRVSGPLVSSYGPHHSIHLCLPFLSMSLCPPVTSSRLIFSNKPPKARLCVVNFAFLQFLVPDYFPPLHVMELGGQGEIPEIIQWFSTAWSLCGTCVLAGVEGRGIETEREGKREITDVQGWGVFLYFEIFCRSLREIFIQLSSVSQ